MERSHIRKERRKNTIPTGRLKFWTIFGKNKVSSFPIRCCAGKKETNASGITAQKINCIALGRIEIGYSITGRILL
jgi:hypothetical protein